MPRSIFGENVSVESTFPFRKYLKVGCYSRGRQVDSTVAQYNSNPTLIERILKSAEFQPADVLKSDKNSLIDEKTVFLRLY